MNRMIKGSFPPLGSGAKIALYDQHVMSCCSKGNKNS